VIGFLLRTEIPSNTGTSSYFYPQHRENYACGKNSPGAPVFFGISALITKSYRIFWDNVKIFCTWADTWVGLYKYGLGYQVEVKVKVEHASDAANSSQKYVFVYRFQESWARSIL